MNVLLSRRSTLSGLALTAAAALPVNKAQAAVPGKIDTHQHFLPKLYVDAIGLDDLAAVMPNKQAPQWSPESALAMMDSSGIAKGVLSISSGPPLPNADRLLRRCNDYAADLSALYPGRFGSFASLPMPDIDASLSEISHSLDVLGADGVILFTNYNGLYLGDPAFMPIMKELNRRKGVVFIHPNHPPYDLPGLPPASVLEFPFDTTRTAASLILSGTLKRFPDIRFILSHAGGTLPYLSQRLAGAVMMNPGLAEKVGDPMAAIRSFYFDTALSMSPSAMAALLAVADPARILFGTDFPMAPPFAIQMSVQGLETASMPEAIRTAIGRDNANRMLSRA